MNFARHYNNQRGTDRTHVARRPWFFLSLATIGLDGFAMVFGLATIGLDGFSMVANHWSNDGMVTIHRYGLDQFLILLGRFEWLQN